MEKDPQRLPCKLKRVPRPLSSRLSASSYGGFSNAPFTRCRTKRFMRLRTRALIGSSEFCQDSEKFAEPKRPRNAEVIDLRGWMGERAPGYQFGNLEEARARFSNGLNLPASCRRTPTLRVSRKKPLHMLRKNFRFDRGQGKY